MEMMDSDDPIKGQLLRQSAHHREQLEEDVKLISEKTEKMITNALIIGGALAATYFLVSSFSKKKSKSRVKKVRIVKDDTANEQVVVEAAEPQTPGVLSQIGTTLASQAAVMLLSLAKEKLDEFMQSQAAKKASADDNS
jgi:hypothetical protein